MNGLAVKAISSSYARLVKSLRSGTRALKGLSGTAQTENLRGPSDKPLSGTATIAGSDTKRRGQHDQNSVARIVRLRRIETAPQPVYDLTVRHDHCYFANGLLVSNSDSFGLAAIVYEEPRMPSQRTAYSGRSSSSGSWMAG
jgi:hypothetical protein